MSFKEKLVQILQKILSPIGFWLYAYSKAANTATTVFFFDGGNSALVIKRKNWPQKGLYAFPGGFLEVGTETLRQCAKREVMEETCITSIPETDFILCDERSDPKRDVRGVIIDNGYYVMVSDEMKPRVLAEMRAGDDAESLEIMSISNIYAVGLAFDHIELLDSAIRAASINR